MARAIKCQYMMSVRARGGTIDVSKYPCTVGRSRCDLPHPCDLISVFHALICRRCLHWRDQDPHSPGHRQDHPDKARDLGPGRPPNRLLSSTSKIFSSVCEFCMCACVCVPRSQRLLAACTCNRAQVYSVKILALQRCRRRFQEAVPCIRIKCQRPALLARTGEGTNNCKGRRKLVE